MVLMHHDVLRVNAPASTDAEQMEILAEAGWVPGPHPDTDPDDPAEVPGVLPESDDPEPKPKGRKATTKES